MKEIVVANPEAIQGRPIPVFDSGTVCAVHSTDTIISSRVSEHEPDGPLAGAAFSHTPQPPFAGETAARLSFSFKETVSQVFVVGTGKGLGFILATLTNIVLIRQLGPAEYGILAVALAVVFLFSGVVGEALDLALLRYIPLKIGQDDEAVDQTLTISLGLKTLAVVLIACPMLLVGYLWSPPALGGGQAVRYILPILFCLIATLLVRSFSTFFQATEQFAKYLWIELAQTFGKFGVVGLLLFSGLLSVYNTLLAFALVPIVTILTVLRWRPKGAPFNLQRNRPVVSTLVGFAKWVTLSYALAAVHSRVDTLLLSYFRDPQEVGLYAAAQAMAAVPEILVTFIGAALIPKIMPLSEAGGFRQCLVASLKYTFPVCLLAGLVMWLLGPHLIQLLYGEGYQQAGPLFRILVVGSVFWWLLWPLVIPFFSMKRPNWEVLVNAATLALIVISSILLVPTFGATATAWIVVAAKIAAGVVVLRLVFGVLEAESRRQGNPT